MNPASHGHRIPLVGAALLVGVTTASAAVVFDNTLNVQPGFGAQITREYGDEIALAGTDRYVTDLVFRYSGDFSPVVPAAQAVVRIYANDGLSALPGQDTAPRPGTLLWESSILSLAPGEQTVVLAPNVLVPDTITWSIQFLGLSGTEGDRAALSLADAPTIGGELLGGVIGSYNDYWVKLDPNDPESWALRQINGGETPANFYAQVTAVPEPSVLALAVLGFGGLAYLQRRRIFG